MYPEFYDKCAVQVKKGWSLCTDSLSACSLIDVNYDMPWPLNIIIKPEQMELYKEMFRFLLKLKWALHTLNHLVFSGNLFILLFDLKHNQYFFADLESIKKPTKKSLKATNYKNKATAKLIRLKFCLINILNSLQHFVFGFVFGKNLLKFELDFEKAYDLNSLIESHSVFIKAVAGTILDLKEKMLDKNASSHVSISMKLLKSLKH